MKHANDNKGQGIRANSGKSEGGNLELTCCTHTQEEKELVPVSSHATLRCAKHTYNTRPFGNASTVRREGGLVTSYRLHKKRKKMKSRTHFP